MRRSCFLILATAALLELTTGPLQAQSPPPYARRFDVPRLTTLGRAMFFDKALSASGRVACASCHDPEHAFGPPNALSVQPSGAAPGDTSGVRATPSLRYLQSLPPFSEHFFDNDGDDSIDKGPTGGHMWDGRASSAHEQARLPLLSPSEMGNHNAAAVAAELRRAPYAADLRAAFGDDVFTGDESVLDAAAMALEVYQQSPAVFYPYSSRYDAVLRGQARLSAREAHGLALFNDPGKGNCASCHISQPTSDGAFPLFTDFGHIAIGVPRNRAILANADPRFFDLGLCGPLRTDLSSQAEDCGRFRTPTLRNVALKKSFFHNGAVHSLEDAVRFYAERDADPQRWYRGAEHPNDLPARYLGNLNVEPPFGRSRGQSPALDEAEISDIVAFLKTLTDADLTDPTRTPAPIRRENPLVHPHP